MALERTLSIIKPDAVAKNLIGAIYNRFESAGLRIVASKMMHLSKEQAEGQDILQDIDNHVEQLLKRLRLVNGILSLPDDPYASDGLELVT